MRIQKNFRITGFSESKELEIKGLELYLNEDIFRRRNVPFSKNLVGRTLIVKLTSGRLVDLHDVKETEMLLKRLEKNDVQERFYQSPYKRTSKIDYSAQFTSAYSITPALPDLRLSVICEEYTQLKKLSSETKFKVNLTII